jgi:hypothetical protein
MKLPSQDIKDFINSSIKFKPNYYTIAENLVGLDSYNVLHVRVSDDYFNSDIDTFKEDAMIKDIQNINLTNNTIIISNNYSLKRRIAGLFGFKFIDNKAEHSGYSDDLESTVIDYIILSQSSRIFCLTVYWHGSGFSEQCAVLNNIPYQVKVINTEQ